MKLPPSLEHELSQLGVRPTQQPAAEKKPERNYEFRKPELDANGEPNF
jgi:hypothetical protein